MQILLYCLLLLCVVNSNRHERKENGHFKENHKIKHNNHECKVYGQSDTKRLNSEPIKFGSLVFEPTKQPNNFKSETGLLNPGNKFVVPGTGILQAQKLETENCICVQPHLCDEKFIIKQSGEGIINERKNTDWGINTRLGSENARPRCQNVLEVCCSFKNGTSPLANITLIGTAAPQIATPATNTTQGAVPIQTTPIPPVTTPIPVQTTPISVQTTPLAVVTTPPGPINTPTPIQTTPTTQITTPTTTKQNTPAVTTGTPTPQTIPTVPPGAITTPPSQTTPRITTLAPPTQAQPTLAPPILPLPTVPPSPVTVAPPTFPPPSLPPSPVTVAPPTLATPTMTSLPPTGLCGTSFVSGTKELQATESAFIAAFAEFPWMLALMDYRALAPDGRMINNAFVCGAALLSKDIAVTAAHCIKGREASSMFIRAGEWNTLYANETIPHQDRSLSKIITHPDFNNVTLFNDIALLKLDQPVLFANNVQPVCLPKGEDKFFGQNCIATGWGQNIFGQSGKYATKMRKVELTILNRNDCQLKLRNTRLGPFFNLHETFICAGGNENYDTCTGDGGGPLFCKVGNTYTQIGIVSWGIGCGQKDVPGVYADVALMRPWIDSTMYSLMRDSLPK